MADSIISLRINKEILKKMRKYDEINWSAILRNCLIGKIENMEKTEDKFDSERAKKASEIMDKIRNSSKAKAGGKTSVELIREWRNRRK